MDGFGRGENAFLMTSDRDLVHDLDLIHWNTSDDIRSTPLPLTLPFGGLGGGTCK